MTIPDAPATKASAGSSSALALTAPVAMGYVPLGMVFGFLFVQAGGAWWLAVCASIFVFAGAAQYMMIPMVAAGMPVATIALATLAVNLRHIFYGLSLLNSLPKPWVQRWYLIFALTDETYAVITTLPAGTRGATMVFVAGLNQAWWVLGTAIGALIGARATVALAGLDFALVALFCVLTVEQWRSSTSAIPLWTALAAYAIAYTLLPAQALLISIALCVVAAMVFHLRDRRVRKAA